MPDKIHLDNVWCNKLDLECSMQKKGGHMQKWGEKPKVPPALLV